MIKIINKYEVFIIITIIFYFLCGNIVGYTMGMNSQIDNRIIYESPYYIDNFNDLVIFLLNDNTNNIEYTSEFDCDNFAYILQNNALHLGYIIDVVPIEPYLYNKYFNDNIDTLHMINGVRVGNSYFLIEPQTDMIIFYSTFD